MGKRVLCAGVVLLLSAAAAAAEDDAIGVEITADFYGKYI